MQSCYAILQLSYLINLAQQLLQATTNDDWQGAEAALFAMR
jgi:hypothetical protein